MHSEGVGVALEVGSRFRFAKPAVMFGAKSTSSASRVYAGGAYDGGGSLCSLLDDEEEASRRASFSLDSLLRENTLDNEGMM